MPQRVVRHPSRKKRETMRTTPGQTFRAHPHKNKNFQKERGERRRTIPRNTRYCIQTKGNRPTMVVKFVTGKERNHKTRREAGQKERKQNGDGQRKKIENDKKENTNNKREKKKKENNRDVLELQKFDRVPVGRRGIPGG